MVEFDRINERILQALSKDGRLPNIELAEKVGLSPSACLRRVQELERSGVIRGYRAVLDAVAMGRSFTAYMTVALNTHSKDALSAFEAAVADAPEVLECHSITGAVEYLMRIEVADLADYKRFHTNVVGTLPHVAAITTYVVMSSPKDLRA